MAIAQHFIERAKGTTTLDYHDVAFSLAYQSMFHSARALLFRNNLKERSHAAMISALLEIYRSNDELRTALNRRSSYKTSRHAIQYDGASCRETDSIAAIKDAERLLDLADFLLAKNEKTRI